MVIRLFFFSSLIMYIVVHSVEHIYKLIMTGAGTEVYTAIHN